MRYINGGQPPWSMSDYMRQVTIMFTKFQSCSTGGGGSSSGGSGGSSHSLANSHHHRSSVQKATNNNHTSGTHNHQNSHNHSQSVHSYAANVLSKLPKLLPTSLPKISSLFPFSPNPAPDNLQVSCTLTTYCAIKYVFAILEFSKMNTTRYYEEN